MLQLNDMEKICRKICESGLKARIWSDRIYINGFGKEITIYLSIKNFGADEHNITFCESITDKIQYGCLRVWVNSENCLPVKRRRGDEISMMILDHLYYSKIIKENPIKPSSESAE